jgi:hypothetical protein
MDTTGILTALYLELFFNDLADAPASDQALVANLVTAVDGGTLSIEEATQLLVEEAKESTGVFAAAYQFLVGGVPTEEGMSALVDSANASDFASFNPENRYINQFNALIQGNPVAMATFSTYLASDVPGDDDLIASISAIYTSMTGLSGPAAADGIAYLTRPDGLAFYRDVAQARILNGSNPAGYSLDEAAAIIAAGSLANILVRENGPGLGFDINNFLQEVADGNSPLPASGNVFTDIDVDPAGTFTLTQGTDAGADFTGGSEDDTFNAPVEQTGLLPIQTLNNTDDLDGMGGRNVLNAQLVNAFTIPEGLTNIHEVNIDGAPGFIVPPVVLDVINANAIEEINFRAPANSVTINNLTTALNTLGLSDDSFGNAFTVNHTGTATDGTADMLDINLNNSNFGSAIVLTHAGGGANQGYEEITVNSMGGLGNTVAIASTNGPATVNVEGNANLNLGASGILNVATLNTFEAGTFTGDLTATFTGTGDVDANSGSGDDMLSFNIIGNATVNGNDGDDMLMFGGQANATASGGNGDDLFRFAQFGDAFNEGVSYNVLDTVDGGDGDDVLEIETASGQNLLAAGVGAGIVAIETIRHVSGHRDFNLNVDMAESGSALNLELAGQYSGLDVNVTNLNNEDWVIYSSSGLDDLTLAQAAPDGALDDLHLRLTNGADMDELITGADIEAVTIDVVASTVVGLTANTIASASNLNSDVVITGGGNLEIGTANAYDLDGGLVDASAYTGNLTVHLGTGQQSVIAGVGNDNIVVEAAGPGNGDMIDITSGGLDTVTFEAQWAAGNGLLAPNAANSITKVTGFALDGTDTLALDVPTIVADTTATNTPVAAGDALVLREIAGGEVSNLMGNDFNFLKFTTPVAGGVTADGAFNAAIGAGSLTVANDADLLAVVYDVTNQQALVFTVVNFDTTIDAADDAWAITTVGMSQAEYAAWNGEGIVFV